jgi:hypothetical protein
VATVLAHEVDLGEALGGAPPQDGAHVGGAQVVGIVGAAAHPQVALAVEARCLVVERQAQRIEQGALARAGGPGDGEEPPVVEGLEVELEGLEAGQILPTNREDTHAQAPSRLTSSSSS